MSRTISLLAAFSRPSSQTAIYSFYLLTVYSVTLDLRTAAFVDKLSITRLRCLQHQPGPATEQDGDDDFGTIPVIYGNPVFVTHPSDISIFKADKCLLSKACSQRSGKPVCSRAICDSQNIPSSPPLGRLCRYFRLIQRTSGSD